jgi:HSP20 family protein
MTSFFKKIVGIETDTNENDPEDDSEDIKSEEVSHSVDIGGEKKLKDSENPKQEKDWLNENYEGQLSVDVYGNEDEIVVISTIAGVKPQDVDISINNDMLTIRGQRSQEKEENIDDYYYQECYWGGFSRSIILPVEVESDKVSASLKNGVLTVRLPRSRKQKSISILVKEE